MFLLGMGLLSFLIFAIMCCVSKDDDSDRIMFLFIVNGIVGVGFLIASLIVIPQSTYNVMIAQSKLRVIPSDINILENRLSNQDEVIKLFLNKYPQEQEMYKKFGVVVLLKLPEIKSNEVILEALRTRLSIADTLYDKELEANKYKKTLEFYKYRWLTGSLISPNY